MNKGATKSEGEINNMSITVERVIATKTDRYEFGEWKEIYEQYERAAQMSCEEFLEE